MQSLQFEQIIQHNHPPNTPEEKRVVKYGMENPLMN